MTTNTEEMKALVAFLNAAHDSLLDGRKMREAMILCLDASAAQKPVQREPLSKETLKRMRHEDRFWLFCDYDEFEQIARAIEAAHGITAHKERT